ncbi:MAG: methionine--tRNA ligase [Nitrospirae bacterium RIFCSPLOWO2_12_FULL_63_8]|nr:MAG: methionine--tRNA ligase [Nitrospirae bacterium RIFCSPLOWO2_12_FULL_63_8]
MSQTFYITTPIYYVNDVPHIGHAYTTVAADVLARYCRLTGRDVLFLTGLDEHGQKVQQAAAKSGVDPQAHCDRLAPQFQNLWKKLHISNDAFIRTTDARHKTIVQQKLQQLFDQKLIYRAAYTGWYCTFDERFWTEKDVVRQGSPQVEQWLCPDCKRPVERLSESNYFFKMGQYQDRLVAHIESHPDFVRPESRRNEVLGFLKTHPLGDLSISRPKSRLTWGIELPFDRDYVTYVWFDALVNYISGPDYLLPKPSLAHYWPASMHLVGKDILTTHAVYWSTMLMALEMPLPQTIFAHGWWTVNGEKMSKSRGNVVDPYAMVDEFGADAFRYFLLREVPFGHDGDFSQTALIGRINSDLANGLGNLLSRTLTMIERFAEGRIPERGTAQYERLEETIKGEAESRLLVSDQLLSSLHFKENLESLWWIIALCDQLIDEAQPWNLAKKPEARPKLNNVLNTLAKALRYLCVFIYPYMPQAAEEMKHQLGLMLNFSKPLLAGEFTWDGLLPGTPIAKGKSLFPRIETIVPKGGARVTDTQPPTPPTAQAGPAAAPVGSTTQITIEDFQKVQLRVAKVLTAERVPKSEKLIKLQVDLGTEQRQIVAGIGKKYAPEELIGRRIVIVANLKPAKLMGVESQGMVLAAGDAEVKELVTLMSEVDPGTKVK